MRYVLTSAALILLAGTANAQSTAHSNTHSAATSAAQNAGNAQSITFNSEASERMRTTPGVAGNGFYGSFSSDFCFGSGGGGVSAGFVGVNAVSPIRDEQCSVLRGVERTMQVAATVTATNPALAGRLQQGAIDMLCGLNDTVGAALRQQGVCTEPAEPVAAPAQPRPAVAGYQGNDPIVISRLQGR